MSLGINMFVGLICGTFASLMLGPEYASDYWLIAVLFCFALQTSIEPHAEKSAQNTDYVQKEKKQNVE